MDNIRTPEEIREQLRIDWDSDNTNHFNYHVCREEIEAELDKAVIRIKELEDSLRKIYSMTNERKVVEEGMHHIRDFISKLFGKSIELKRKPMNRFIDEECDRVDAAVFSGDALVDSNNRNRFRDLLGRWGRECARFDKTYRDELLSKNPYPSSTSEPLIIFKYKIEEPEKAGPIIIESPGVGPAVECFLVTHGMFGYDNLKVHRFPIDSTEIPDENIVDFHRVMGELTLEKIQELYDYHYPRITYTEDI